MAGVVPPQPAFTYRKVMRRRRCYRWGWLAATLALLSALAVCMGLENGGASGAWIGVAAEAAFAGALVAGAIALIYRLVEMPREIVIRRYRRRWRRPPVIYLQDKD